MHVLEGLIVLTLLAWAENILVSLIVLPFLVSKQITLVGRFLRYRDFANNAAGKKQTNPISKSKFNRLLIQKMK